MDLNIAKSAEDNKLKHHKSGLLIFTWLSSQSASLLRKSNVKT